MMNYYFQCSFFHLFLFFFYFAYFYSFKIIIELFSSISLLALLLFDFCKLFLKSLFNTFLLLCKPLLFSFFLLIILSSCEYSFIFFDLLNWLFILFFVSRDLFSFKLSFSLLNFCLYFERYFSFELFELLLISSCYF